MRRDTLLRDVAGKRVLLLQGPPGPFFRRFADDLRQRGCVATKVNFVPGDDLFYRGPEVVRHRGSVADWEARCRALVHERQVQMIFLYDANRPVHRRAIAIAKEARIVVWAFDEGLLRPGFVTLTRADDGAEPIPNDPADFHAAAAALPPLPPPLPVGNTVRSRAAYVAAYVAANVEPRAVLSKALAWTRSGCRKLWLGPGRRRLAQAFNRRGGRPYFVAVPQRGDDMGAFLREVIAAYTRSSCDADLVIRQSPDDDRDHARVILDLGRELGCAERLYDLRDVRPAKLLKRARGVVTSGGALGLQALGHETPVKVLGEAPYDMPGLTSGRTLEAFFGNPGRVDRGLLRAFVRWLREEHQLNGSFYVTGTGFARCGLDLAPFDREPRQALRTFSLALPGGAALEVVAPLSMIVPRELMEGGLANYEPETLACFLTCLEVAPAGAVLDIGANVGLFSWLAAVVGKRHAVAFEPTPAVADCAAAIIRQNRLDIDLEISALADHNGDATFYISARADTSSSLNARFRKASERIVVPIETVDAYCERTGLVPAVMKIDTESTEDAVLRGAQSVLAAHRPWMICEVLAGRCEDRLVAAIAPFGYRYFPITARLPLDGRDVIAGDPSHTHRNWLFAPEPPDAAFWKRVAAWQRALAACGSAADQIAGRAG